MEMSAQIAEIVNPFENGFSQYQRLSQMRARFQDRSVEPHHLGQLVSPLSAVILRNLMIVHKLLEGGERERLTQPTSIT